MDLKEFFQKKVDTVLFIISAIEKEHLKESGEAEAHSLDMIRRIKAGEELTKEDVVKANVFNGVIQNYSWDLSLAYKNLLNYYTTAIELNVPIEVTDMQRNLIDSIGSNPAYTYLFAVERVDETNTRLVPKHPQMLDDLHKRFGSAEYDVKFYASNLLKEYEQYEKEKKKFEESQNKTIIDNNNPIVDKNE